MTVVVSSIYCYYVLYNLLHWIFFKLFLVFCSEIKLCVFPIFIQLSGYLIVRMGSGPKLYSDSCSSTVFENVEFVLPLHTVALLESRFKLTPTVKRADSGTSSEPLGRNDREASGASEWSVT